MEQTIKKIKENWNILPKSNFDKEEVVIFAEESGNYNENYGHHNYNGYGVNENGEIVWCYSSGCSCKSRTDVQVCNIVECQSEGLKTFKIKNYTIEELEYDTINFEKLKVRYDSY